MTHRLVVAGVALVALTAFAPAPLPKEKPKKGPTHLQGTWVLEGLTRDGVPALTKAKTPASTKIRIEGNKWTFVRTSTSTIGYVIKLDPSKNPCWMDLYREGNESSVYMRGIVTVEGDRLKFCYLPKAAEERPTSFDTKNTRAILMTLKREKE